ncbi:LacI family DNA-binding transcriptional regulator [Saccharothrix yanglingensis]|uniref:LacI family transcriptional regulator n=1 Tax=Saccharothrix yanglingensis TaxID=659496 RepID=A0ABU0X9V1_9PSEU|nr:LacI family DNA-binding transcriptional regulator [Saccharothrix yanglingensis]MDQ2588880.1 LacI family transcriptional regulator [Saccharothrix yanglingensis]
MDGATARLSDIAAQAGVGEATVSRVFNGKAGVSATTRQAVGAAVDLLGYERPPRLRQRSAGSIGLITPELGNPIFPAPAQVVEQVLTGAGYTPLLCTRTPGGSTGDQLTEVPVERGVAGIVFVSGLHADSTADTGRSTRLAGRGIPFVMINGCTEEVAAPFMSTDDRAALRLAVSHLVEPGHERIGLAVGPRRFTPVLCRTEGFVRAVRTILHRTAEEAEALVQHSLFTVEGGQSAASALLDQGCTAVVCGSDLMAFGAIRAARRRGLSVPRDVSVVGFDDSPLIVFADPPLTTPRRSVEAMGRAAVHALPEGIGGTRGGSPPSTHAEFVFLPELVVRGSTGAGPR